MNKKKLLLTAAFSIMCTGGFLQGMKPNLRPFEMLEMLEKKYENDEEKAPLVKNLQKAFHKICKLTDFMIKACEENDQETLREIFHKMSNSYRSLKSLMKKIKDQELNTNKNFQEFLKGICDSLDDTNNFLEDRLVTRLNRAKMREKSERLNGAE